MKRFMAFTAALAMLVTVSCSGKTGQSEAGSSQSSEMPANVQTLRASQTKYKETDIDLPEDFGSRLMLYYDSGVKLVYINEDDLPAIQSYSEDMTPEQVTILKSSVGSDFSECLCCRTGEGNIALLYTIIDYDGDYSDVEDYKKNAQVTFVLEIYSPTGELLTSAVTEGLEEYYTVGETFFSSICSYGDSFIVSGKDGWILLDVSGSVPDVNAGTDSCAIAQCTDGRFICCDMTDWGFMDGETLKTPGNKLEYGEWLRKFGTAFPGSGGYIAFICLNEGIGGIDKDGNLTILFDYTDSDVDASYIDFACYAGKDRFVICGVNQTSSSGITLSLLTKRPEDYTESREPLLIGCESYDNNASDTVTMFNKFSDNYRAELKQYTTADDLKMDVLSGSPPDVFWYRDSATMYKYANLGAFTDLYTLMDKDGGLSREDIVPNVLTACEYKGGLYGIPLAFSMPGWIANRQVVSREYTNWNFD